MKDIEKKRMCIVLEKRRFNDDIEKKKKTKKPVNIKNNKIWLIILFIIIISNIIHQYIKLKKLVQLNPNFYFISFHFDINFCCCLKNLLLKIYLSISNIYLLILSKKKLKYIQYRANPFSFFFLVEKQREEGNIKAKLNWSELNGWSSRTKNETNYGCPNTLVVVVNYILFCPLLYRGNFFARRFVYYFNTNLRVYNLDYNYYYYYIIFVVVVSSTSFFSSF